MSPATVHPMRQVSTDPVPIAQLPLVHGIGVLADQAGRERLDQQGSPGAPLGPAVPSPQGWAQRLPVFGSRSGLALFVLGAFSFTVSLLLQATLFRHGSGDADEAAYVLQARMLLHGRLTLDQNLVDPFFRPWLTGVHNGRVFTKYLPGWPAMLAVSQLLFGTMAVAPALAATAWVVATYRLARELFDDVATALTAALFLALSPLTLLHTALPMAYAFTSAVLTGAMAALLRGTRTGARSSLVAAGVALGLAATARPFDAALVATLCFPFLLARGPRSPLLLLRHAAWVSIGAAPFIVTIMVFCRYVTGSVRILPLAASDPLDRFGFGARRILPSEPTFAFTRRLAGEAFRATLDAAPGWLFGGTALVVLAGFGLLTGLALGGRRAGHLLLAVTVLGVFAAYFFWWGSAMALPGLVAGLGPHYHMTALSPAVILAASGACRLWRAVPGRFPRAARTAVAAGCGLALAAVTAAGLPAKVNVQRYVNAVDGQVLGLIPKNLAGPAVVIVAPPTPSRYTQVPYHFLRNDPELSDGVLYAADLGAADVRLAETMPGRRLYQLRPDEMIEAENPWSTRGSFTELHLVDGSKIKFRVSAVLPEKVPYASVYLRVGDRTVTRPLPATPATGSAASSQAVTWTLTGAATAGAAGTAGVDVSLAAADLADELVVGLVASDRPDMARAWRWEDRIPVARHPDGRLVALTPGQGWRQVPGQYGEGWVQAAITAALSIAVEPGDRVPSDGLG
ncbi:glycosyltransferase family 39 protein [Frankia sp. CiP3]|uniref:DUF7846 domain-containing protein n=1 Tax=Frankia sp. CiP3 TaxID=2880971 RepID=UPI001EF74856|nr:glycosyltransferase family 39 protein [Frankia sp. CiP3]